jgi:hypothetical protein
MQGSNEQGSSERKRATGIVDEIYVDRDLVIVYLAYDDDNPGHERPETEPQSGEFRILRGTNDNSNALFSLALASASNQWTVTIVTWAEIESNKFAEVKYLWKRGTRSESGA